MSGCEALKITTTTSICKFSYHYVTVRVCVNMCACMYLYFSTTVDIIAQRQTNRPASRLQQQHQPAT